MPAPQVGPGEAGADRVGLPYRGPQLSAHASRVSPAEPRAEEWRATAASHDLDAVDALGLAAFGAGQLSVRDELARPIGRIWVTRDEDGHVVAALSAWLVADELTILHVVTHPAHQRAGHGEALVRAALAHARHAGARTLLEVRRSNTPALRLYEKLGFTVTGERAGYYADGEDAVELAAGA